MTASERLVVRRAAMPRRYLRGGVIRALYGSQGGAHLAKRWFMHRFIIRAKPTQ
jgi:hypothetical protein